MAGGCPFQELGECHRRAGEGQLPALPTQARTGREQLPAWAVGLSPGALQLRALARQAQQASFHFP